MHRCIPWPKHYMEEVKMKKFIALLLALVTALSLVACGSKDNGQQPSGGDASGDKVVKIGIFEPTSGQNGAGGKKS